MDDPGGGEIRMLCIRYGVVVSDRCHPPITRWNVIACNVIAFILGGISKVSNPSLALVKHTYAMPVWLFQFQFRPKP